MWDSPFCRKTAEVMLYYLIMKAMNKIKRYRTINESNLYIGSQCHSQGDSEIL